MINKDSIKKYLKNKILLKEVHPGKQWTQDIDLRVDKFISRLDFIKIGFPGVNNNLLSISTKLSKNSVYILDHNLDDNYNYLLEKCKVSPIMVRIIDINNSEIKAKIIGFGIGEFIGTSNVGDIINNINTNGMKTLLKVNSFGNGHYIKKANKDNRYKV